MKNVLFAWLGLVAVATAQYDLRNIEFLSNLSAADSGIQEVSNDIWGWTDTLTQREYALVGRNSRTVFVDVTDPYSPEYLGYLPSTTDSSTWRDIKVYSDHAYVVSDNNGPHGVQIFDLTRLRGITEPQTFAPDSVFTGTRSAHNIAINEETGYAYVTDGRVLDLLDPKNPVQVGTVAAGTHDSHAVVYRGPDPNFNGSEVLFSFTGSNVEIFDVSDKADPSMLSSIGTGDYEHQGWLSVDHRYLFINSEFDQEWTQVLDVSNLSEPVLVGNVENLRRAYDHNLYVKENYIYAANYTAGLRVFRINDASTVDIEEVAHIDTYPDFDRLEYFGAWSVYPFFDSGTIIVNDRKYGLFAVRLNLDQGDFDDDGSVDLLDVDMLTAAIAANSMDTSFDMNADGLVDAADIEAWLEIAGANDYGSGKTYLLGDANLDGVVDVSDFNQWNSNKFQSGTTWSRGDFNGDGVTDVSDFNIWNMRRFQAITDAVPEPSSSLGLIGGFLILSLRRRSAKRFG